VVKLGIVGAGIMGASHARVALTIPDAQVAVVVDSDEDSGQRLAAHVGASYAASLDELPGRVDAAIIAVPTEIHGDVAHMLLENGIDVLVEKPITSTVAEAESLIALADKHDRILMVGHVERFNPAVLELSRYVNGLIHIDIRRVGPFSPRVSTGVILDLMIHDIDLALMLAGSQVKEILALARRVRGATEDLATCALTFDNGMSATLTASRVGQAKHRQIELTQRDDVVVADLIRQQVTVHRLEHAEFVDDRGAGYRQSGVIEIPYLEHQGEPLALELRHFIDCVLSRSQPVVDGHDGLAALETALRIRSKALLLG
jgi:UDP-N-acetylglucosamine 3-dehydrogenase